MLHKFFEPGDWFAPKAYGYGAGWPIAWQGWAVLIAYVGLVTGTALMIETNPRIGWTLFAVVFPLSSLLLFVIIKHRTRGGLRWRNGKDEKR